MSKALWSEPASHPLMAISGAGFRGEGETTQPAWLYHKSRSSRPLQPITCSRNRLKSCCHLRPQCFSRKGEGNPWRTGMEAAWAVWAMRKKSCRLRRDAARNAQTPSVKRSWFTRGCLEVSPRNSPCRHPRGPCHGSKLHGEPWTTCQENTVPGTWMGEDNHSSVIQETTPLHNDLWAAAGRKAEGTWLYVTQFPCL